MNAFTFGGYEFESRQSEAYNIVWLKSNPDDSESMPRSFNFEEVAEHFLINRGMPEYKVPEPIKRSDYDKEVRLQVAYDIIGNLDDNALRTEWIDKAIEKLKLLKHVRENIPF